jgi:hypothetical protein
MPSDEKILKWREVIKNLTGRETGNKDEIGQFLMMSFWREGDGFEKYLREEVEKERNGTYPRYLIKSDDNQKPFSRESIPEPEMPELPDRQVVSDKKYAEAIERVRRWTSRDPITDELGHALAVRLALLPDFERIFMNQIGDELTGMRPIKWIVDVEAAREQWIKENYPDGNSEFEEIVKKALEEESAGGDFEEAFFRLENESNASKNIKPENVIPLPKPILEPESPSEGPCANEKLAKAAERVKKWTGRDPKTDEIGSSIAATLALFPEYEEYFLKRLEEELLGYRQRDWILDEEAAHEQWKKENYPEGTDMFDGIVEKAMAEAEAGEDFISSLARMAAEAIDEKEARDREANAAKVIPFKRPKPILE